MIHEPEPQRIGRSSWTGHSPLVGAARSYFYTQLFPRWKNS